MVAGEENNFFEFISMFPDIKCLSLTRSIGLQRYVKNLIPSYIFCSNITLFLLFFVILQPLIEMSIYNRYIIKDDSQFE